MAVATADSSDLARGALRPHLRRLAVPASTGFFFNVLFNVTDTYCAGLLSTDAQAALAFSFPLFFISLSVAIGLTQGTTGLLARAKGAGKQRQSRYFLGQSFVLAGALGLGLAVAGNLAAASLLSFLGSTPVQQELGLGYIRWIYAFAPLMLLGFVFSGALSSNGNTHTYRNALVISSLANMVLDPALALGWFGLPALGMDGIGIATVLAFALQLAIMLPAVVRLPVLAGWKNSYLKPRRLGLLHCTRQAWPPATNMLAICFGFMINTYYIATIDTVAVAAYGIALRIEQMILLLTVGLNIALLSIAGQCYGAGDYARLNDVYRMALNAGLVLVAGGAVFLLLLGRTVIGLFNEEEQVIAYGYEYLVVAAILGPMYIYAHTATAMLQAVGRPTLIGVFGLVRLLALPLLLCWLLVTRLEMGTLGVWLSLLLANLVVTVALHIYTHSLLGRVAPRPAVPAT